MVIATSWKAPSHYFIDTYIKFGIPVYIGHLLAQHQTSWLGTILVVFSVFVTIGVAAYLYHAFREFKRANDPLSTTYDLEAGETEFEIAPGIGGSGLDEAGKPTERAALVTRTSDDDFFSDEDEVAL